MNYSKHFMFCFFICLISWRCDDNNKTDKVSDDGDIDIDYVLPYMETPNHESGIALFTADWAMKNRTEIGSEYQVKSNSNLNVSQQIVRNGLNSALRIDFNNMTASSDVVELLMSGFSAISGKDAVPKELQKQIKGIKFKAVAIAQSIDLELEIQDEHGNVIKKQNFIIDKTEMKTYSMFFNSSSFKNLSFKIKHNHQKNDFDGTTPKSIIIDDVYYINGKTTVFAPPEDDREFLRWIQKSALRFFIWNYRDIGNGKGYVLGANDFKMPISIGGQAFGIAAFILAENEGMLKPKESKRRIKSILKWMHEQDWYSGQDGWKGFPHHWFNTDGSPGYQGQGTSTVDWAIAAAGIRVARQYYKDDKEIYAMSTELLNRPIWKEVFDKEGYIAMGIDIETGKINPWRWGTSFTEEAELTYLEARNSNQFDKTVFEPIVRDKSLGFYSGFWSTGFEFNWMQLWTGPIEPFKSNSIIAYQNDAKTCESTFGRPIMGLTAVGITNEIDSLGFAKIRYFGDQGSMPCRSGNNKQIAPAPYGAALALPFVPELAIKGLREYINLGYYHPLIGLPGSVRLIPFENNSLPKVIPNWGSADLEYGPMAIAIDQYFDNIIGQLYQQDPEVKVALTELIESLKN